MSYRDAYIQLASGRTFRPLDPDPARIDPESIAAALSKLCRFGGHCREFYSVAEHSLWVSYKCDPQDALWGLLHDAPEGLGLLDLTSKVKVQIPYYQAYEAALMRIVCHRFGLPTAEPRSVKTADRRMLKTEVLCLMTPGRDVEPGCWDYLADVEPYDAGPWLPVFKSPAEAERAWLYRFRRLTAQPPECHTLGVAG